MLLAINRQSMVLPPNDKELIRIKKDTSDPGNSALIVKITRSWPLPELLKKISGIDYLDSTRFICVQDELGSVFTYNLITNSVESEIPFGPPGDYEAVAVVEESVYVACADGRLFEIAGYNSSRPSVKEYGTHLSVKQNVEGLSYDRKTKLLLVSIKGKEDDNQFYKGIYAFNPMTKKMAVKPYLKIDLQDPVFKRIPSKKLALVIQPSEIAVHPLTGDLYIIDAIRQQLLIMDKSGNIKSLSPLNKTDFPQPEGITFSPNGDCYISNAGNKQQPATLLLVEMNTAK